MKWCNRCTTVFDPVRDGGPRPSQMTLLSILTMFVLARRIGLVFVTSPLTLGLFSFVLALCVVVFLAGSLSTWFGLIGILVYLGGLLVMFAYFLAICPNQVISAKKPIKVVGGSFLLLCFIIRAFPPRIASPYMSRSFVRLYLPQNAGFLLGLAVFLFLTLIVVVKIARRREGPLRPFRGKSAR